jgi:tetratricopeptide (TPR) repeat protein
MGQHREAIADFTSALVWHPRAGHLYYDRGRNYLALNRFDRAADDLSKAIMLNQAKSNYYSLRGVAFAELEQWPKADADFARAAQLGPRLKGLCNYNRAMVCLARKDTAGYRKLCTSMVEDIGKKSDPNAVFWAAWTTALTAKSLADPSRILPLAEKTLGRDPRNGDYLNTLGAVLYRAGQFDPAIQRLLQAQIALREMAKPGQTVVYTHLFLAMAHQRLGHAEKARQWLKQATDQIDRARPARFPWNRRLTLQLLHLEADALIQPTIDGSKNY